MNVEKKLFSGQEQLFTVDEISELAEKFQKLQSEAAQGEYYRSKLVKEVKALSAAALPELGMETLDFITDKMNISQLDELKKAFEKKAAEMLPIKPQLFKSKENVKNSNTIYQNI